MGGQQGKFAPRGGSMKRKPDEKKKPTPNVEKDEQHQNDDSDSLDSDNLDSCADDEKNLFVALYVFHSGVDNQLDLVKGDKVIVLEYDESKEWSKVEKQSDPVRKSGWVPTKYIASVSSHSKFSWFHGPMSRNAAEYLLSSGITGSFLVRESESCLGQMTLSVRYEEKYFHYKIQRDVDTFFVAVEQQFASLNQLVKFYATESGLVATLQFAVRKVNKPPVFALSPEMDKWEVDRNEIEMKQLLGSGQYGDVYEATWKKHNRQVAIKTLRADSTELDDFLKEVTVMKEMKHPNLVQLLGICTWQPPYYIITEYMSQGNLRDYLRSSSPEELGQVTLFYMATQIASAMGYLEEKNFIHRDLAARNCLVGDHHLVKVADFGLARLLELDDTYTAQTACKFPIKWTAPEGLMYGSFSTKSDVWAFGVLLWELATYGETPYPSIDLQDVYLFLERGSRMSCPSGCPSVVYNLMLQCWKWESADRPTFREIHDNLNSLQKPDISEELELKHGGSETNSSAVNNNHTESMSTMPPLSHVRKPSDFHLDLEARLPAAESGVRKPPMPPKKDHRDHQAVKQDGVNSRSHLDNVKNNRLIGHQHSMDDTKNKHHKTHGTDAKPLPSTPLVVNPAVLGAISAGLRKAAEREAPKPSLNDEQLSEVRSSLKKLPNPPSKETAPQMKHGDASGAKYRTMPNCKSGTNIETFEIPSQGIFVQKKKAHSASDASDVELDSNSEDSGSGQLRQLAKPAVLNFTGNKLESSRTLTRQNSGDASISVFSAGPQKNPPLPTKPKPPITGPKPTVGKSSSQP